MTATLINELPPIVFEQADNEALRQYLETANAAQR
jgi:hypothetical protein